MWQQVKLTHNTFHGVGNNRIFTDRPTVVEIDIPIDPVDDGVEATFNRRGAVRAFRCHGTKDGEKYSKVITLRFATGQFI